MKCLCKLRISSKQDCHRPLGTGLSVAEVFSQKAACLSGNRFDTSPWNVCRKVVWTQCFCCPFSCLPCYCYLRISLAQNLFFIECLLMESGGAGRFVLVRCSCLPAGCCRCLISSLTAVVMKQRAGAGHGDGPSRLNSLLFLLQQRWVTSSEDLRPATPALNSVSFGILIATTFPGEPQPLYRSKNNCRLLGNFLRIRTGLPSLPSAA